ncbi:MAG: hypothetical protein Q4F69_11560 [Bacteroidia bacterium]|nr:hypothetical protein [Bacteroidia bacterium]
MKKNLFTIVLLVLAFQQCRKPVLMDYNGLGGKQTISFTSAGGGDEKGDFIEDGNMKYKWNRKDVLFVYGLDSGKNGVGYAGALITDDNHIYLDGYKATFEGELEVPEGTKILRFVHYGNEGNVVTSGAGVGAAYVDLSIQDGSIDALSDMVVSYCDLPYVENQKKYEGRLMLTCFAIIRFNFSDYAGYCTDINLAGVPYNAIQVTEMGDITFVSSSSTNIRLRYAAGQTAYNVAIPFDSPTEKKKFAFDFTGGDYSTIGDIELCSNKYYHGSSKTGAPGIMIKRQCANLGLPSGKRWMLWNVGANDPKEGGNQYQWASTVPWIESTSNWNTYCWGNGEFFKSDNKDIFKKYHGGIDGYVAPGSTLDDFTRIQDDDDAAKQTFGDVWSVPSKNDFQELRDNCYWEIYGSGDNWGYIVYKTQNHKGWWTYDGGTEDKSGNSQTKPNYAEDDKSLTRIYLCAKSGIIERSKYSGYGAYWTADMVVGYPEGAWVFLFNHYNTLGFKNVYRYAAYTIRAVTDAPPTDGVGTVSPFGSGNW